MEKLLCFLGFHKPYPIGTAPFPWDLKKTIVGMGCKRCGKKLANGQLVDTNKLELFMKNYERN